jgi:hypothetical protein
MTTEEPKQPKHYLNNKEFSQAVVDYVNSCNEAKENSLPTPIVTDYIATSFMAIANKLSNRSNFARYTYRDEMVMDAVENCLRAINNYKYDYTTRTGLPNAFSYFTQICFYAFVRRIQKENKQVDIKNEFTLKADHDSFLHYGESGLNRSDFSVDNTINTLKDKINLIERTKKFKTAIRRIVTPKGIERFYKK